MKNVKLIIGLVAVVVVIVAVWFFMGGGPEKVAVDLMQNLPSAEKRTTYKGGSDPAFSVSDVTINGEKKRAIFAPSFSRIIWPITVPRRGTLKVSFALRPDTWSSSGDGAQFRIGVSDNRTYEEYLREFVNPIKRSQDRRWFSTTIDLSPYEGQSVKLIFNTDPGPPRRKKNSRESDWAVWAQPVITTR